MADPSFNCSISSQDCAKRNYDLSDPDIIPFTSSSCVPDVPWYTDDIGICGWIGAPCTNNSLYSNCQSNFAELCDNGRCGFGLGNSCPDRTNRTLFCNGYIMCGTDGLCGGHDARVDISMTYQYILEHNFVRQLCMSGVIYNDSAGLTRCTDPLSPSPPSTSMSASTPTSSTTSTSGARGSRTSTTTGAIVGGILGGLIILLAIFWYLYRKRTGSTLTAPHLKLPSFAVQVAEVPRLIDSTSAQPSSSRPLPPLPLLSDVADPTAEMAEPGIVPLATSVSDLNPPTVVTPPPDPFALHSDSGVSSANHSSPPPYSTL